MKEKEDLAAAVIPPPANDNGPEHGAAQEAERHLDTIARAIGRHIAREHIRAWEQERRKRAVNDNEGRSANSGQNAPVGRFEDRMPKEEGREPDG
jgi:DNA-binding transcriptional regulator YdaS (Cro superfamily)